MDNVKLKLCPFCGGKAEFRRESLMTDKRIKVQCTKCDAQTALVSQSVDYCAKDEVTKRWNRRDG